VTKKSKSVCRQVPPKRPLGVVGTQRGNDVEGMARAIATVSDSPPVT
jgi:hypothetical protein